MNVTTTRDGRIAHLDDGLILGVFLDRNVTDGYWSDHYAAYRVTLTRSEGEPIVSWVGDKDHTLNLPYVDHDRALRDAAGFLSYYASDEVEDPDDEANADHVALTPFADILSEAEYELSDAEE